MSMIEFRCPDHGVVGFRENDGTEHDADPEICNHPGCDNELTRHVTS
jgi:hypothetical protein